MHAVVLVGGFGTRLRPLTNDVPKPMLPVGHRPMIVGLLDRLARAGVSDVVLALGFRPEPFERAFPDGRYGDVRVHYAVEPEPLDTGGAIAFAARAAGVSERFLVLNGDVVCDLELSDLIDAHGAVDATLHLTPVADPSAFGVVELDDDGRVARFVEKPAPGETDSNLINAGAYVFDPPVLDLIEPGRRVSIERDVFPVLVDEGRIGGLPTDDYWIDTGRPELYLQANLDLLDRGGTHAGVVPVSDEADVAHTATIDESLVAAGATVGEGASVHRSLLLPGAEVGAGATVERSIVAGFVGRRATVSRTVIGADGRVPDGATVIDERIPRPD